MPTSETEPTPSPTERPQQKAGIWPYVPVLLLGSMVGGLLLMIRIATDDPQFSVETDYYQKALN